MHRCIELARLGAGNTRSNPMVGSVLVYNERIIGEGYHSRYGEAHAEVNCINSVSAADQQFITRSTIYVSLEPCAHFGKTPPCADLIIAKNIKHAVIGCRDPFEAVNGKGIDKLKAAGINVELGTLEKECRELNKRFFTFHTRHRPYIILKWAQTADHMIGNLTAERLMITNDFSNRMVHKWRREEMGIMVGTNTALADNPSLNTRLWPGNDPVRVIIDLKLRLPHTLKLFDGNTQTLVFNSLKTDEKHNIRFIQVDADTDPFKQILMHLYDLQITSLLIEGGGKLLQSFIDEGCWDEARVFTNTRMFSGKGIAAPVLQKPGLSHMEQLENDTLQYFYNPLKTEELY